MIYTIAATVALISYFLGSINTSVILSKSIYGDDVRDYGSGNAGATNMLRVHGAGIAVLTLICDVLKGALAVLITFWLQCLFPLKAYPMSDFEYNYLVGNLHYIAGLFVVLGHDFPIWFGFRGGKGVAASLGVIISINWKIGLIVLFLALLIMIFSRYVSLGSIIAAVVYPFILITYIIAGGEKLNITYLIMALMLALILILKHHANISRLRNGTENKLFSKKDKLSENNIENEDMEDNIE